jgi:hypothetical protein
MMAAGLNLIVWSGVAGNKNALLVFLVRFIDNGTAV